MNTSRREKVHLATRDEIISTAWKQMAETGAAGLSLRAIAREMEMTAPALYRYFEDRDSLVTALIIEAFTSFADALESARDACPAKDHAGRFRAISLAYRQWAISYPQRYMLIFGTPIAGYCMPEEASVASQRSFLVLVSVIAQAYQARKIRLSPKYEQLTSGLEARYELLQQIGLTYPPVVQQLALASWSWIHGLTSLELYGYLPGFLGDQVESFVRFELDSFMKTLGFK
ncbi:MAG TPA: TetR/AcrR family transcriptional regulator [Anaerolineales bacterium]|nr:TetR/AcrR family transcriptional regulator [Anaerolineales bacterium]